MNAKPADAVSFGSRSISSTLLEQLCSGRADAWQRFVNIYSAVIYRWCRRSGLAAEDSADVLQEVLLAVARHLPKLRHGGPHDSFTAWLATVTRNKVRDLRRRQFGKAEARGGTTAQLQWNELPQPPDVSEESIRPDAESEAWLSHGVLQTIQAEFEQRTWEAFWRTTVDGQPPADVAADLSMSVAAVYMAKSRILRRLRQAMAELP